MLFDSAIASGSLSQSDLAVVDFITRHAQETLRMTARELAEAAYVSPATVVRLCKKAGFEGFGAMKVALARELADEEAYQHLDADFPELSGASASQVVTRVSSLEREAVRKTERLMADVSWDPMVEALERCQGIGVYGAAYSLDACAGFVRDLRRLGRRVTVLGEPSEAREWASACPRDELNILLSYSGRTSLTIDAARILWGRGIKSIAITAQVGDELSRCCTWTIPLALTQTPFAADRISNLQSRASQSYALNVLYALYVSRNYTAVRHELEQSLERQGVRVDRATHDGPTLVPLDAGHAPGWLAGEYIEP